MATNLVGSLIQSLCVDGSTKPKSDTGPKELVVSKGSNSLVVDLGLYGC